MPILRFPDPRHTGPEGLVAIGGDLHPQSLLLAYRQGIFPWPVEDEPLLWFSPPERGILRFSKLHLSRSLKKTLKNSPFRLSFDEAFARVIFECAVAKRPEQDGTWILHEMIEAYTEFHRLGHAHSVEVWDGERLVGGLYGVEVAGVFAGESMFHREPNASKLALLHIVEHLKSRGLEWMDIQMLTPHMEALGAELIPRDEFLSLLKTTQAKNLTFR